MTKYTAPAAALNAYRSLSQRGFAPLKQAAILVEEGWAADKPLTEVCRSIDLFLDGDGKVPANVYHKTNAATVLLMAGFPVAEQTSSKSLDLLATIVNRVVLGTFAGKTARADIEPTVVDTIERTYDVGNGSVRDIVNALMELEDKTREDNAKTTPRAVAAETIEDDEIDAPAETETVSPTIDVLKHIAKAKKIAETLSGLPASELREIIKALHATADAFANVTELAEEDTE